MAIPLEQRERDKLSYLWKLYIEEFYHGDEKLWHRQKEPYIFYKHLFRKFVWTKVYYKEHLRDLEEYVTKKRPNHASIYNSLNKDPNYFKLTHKELKEALFFLNKYYDTSLLQNIKTRIMKAKNMGYTKDDIARHCRVHIEVIEDVLANKNIDYNLLKQMESELE